MMANGKTSVLALFPGSKPQNDLKKTKLTCTPACKQKYTVLAPTQTPNLTHTETLALTLTLIPTQTQNLNPNTNNNNLKKKKVNEYPLLLSYSR